MKPFDVYCESIPFGGKWSVDWSSWKWFGLGSPRWMVGDRSKGRHMIRPWNLFRRENGVLHQWGIGLFQYGHNHLIYVGRNDQSYVLSFLWIGNWSIPDRKV